MPKVNAVLMTLLSAAVIGVLGWRVMGGVDDGAADRTRTTRLLRKLADPDPDLRREAELEFKSLGIKGMGILRETAKAADPRLAERASALLRELEPKASPEPAEPAGPEPFLSCTDRFAVEFCNTGGAPLLIALEKTGEEPRFGWFEVEDAGGRTQRVRARSYAPPVVEGPAHVVALPPGARQVLYHGWEPLAALLPALPHPCKVRFVYDATEGSPYRGVVRVSAQGVPLKPARHVSAPLEAR